MHCALGVWIIAKDFFYYAEPVIIWGDNSVTPPANSLYPLVLGHG
jgi:hypothetical protein